MSWWAGPFVKFLGYEPVGQWRVFGLDPDRRRGGSLPARVPVPKEAWKEWGRKQRPTRLSHATVAEYAERFVNDHPNHALAADLKPLVAKAPLAAKVEEALKRKSWGEAETILREVVRIDPGDARAEMLIGLCLLERGELDAAEGCLGTVAGALGDDPDFHLFRGRLAEQRGEVEPAKAAYREALALQEDHPVVLERMAFLGEMVEIYLGDLDEPQRAYVPADAYEKVIVDSWEQESRGPEFYLERSEFHLRNGQASLALKAADLAVTRAVQSGTPEIEAAGQAARTRALIAGEDFGAAEEALLRLATLDPDGEAALACRGQLLWFTGKREEAAVSIRQAIAANPDRMENLHLFLDPDFPRSERDRAGDLQQLIKDHPQSWAVKGLAATVAMVNGDWVKGAALAAEAASLGAADELLIELTGRLGRQNMHSEIATMIAWAGGWERFESAHPMLRCNLAASLLVGNEAAAARTLWLSVADDEEAHPEIRIRARRALSELESPDAR